MYIKRVIFLSFLFFSNLSYSDNNNQQLLIKDPKKVETFSIKDINDSEKTISSSENKILFMKTRACRTTREIYGIDAVGLPLV